VKQLIGTANAANVNAEQASNNEKEKQILIYQPDLL